MRLKLRGGTLLGQMASLTTWRVLAAGLQAVGFLVLSRVVSVPEVGLVGLVTSVGAFAALATDLGVATLISRARALRQDALVAGGLRVNHVTAVGFAAIGAGVLVVLSWTSGAPAALSLLLLSLAMERHTETQLSVFFADANTRTPAISIASRRVVGLAVFLAMLAAGVDGVTAYCGGQLAGNVVGAAHLAFARRRVEGLDAAPVPARAVVRASWPFWLSGVLNQVRLLDVAVVGAVVGTYAAGLYSAAQRLTNPLLLIPNAMASIVLPHSSRLVAADAKRLAFRVIKAFMALLVVALPIALLSRPLMTLVFGRDYGDAGPVLAAIIIGLPFVALTSPLTAILQSQGHERLVASIAVVFAVLTLGSLVIGAFAFSIVGAAAAVGIVAALRCAVLTSVIWRHRDA